MSPTHETARRSRRAGRRWQSRAPPTPRPTPRPLSGAAPLLADRVAGPDRTRGDPGSGRAAVGWRAPPQGRLSERRRHPARVGGVEVRAGRDEGVDAVQHRVVQGHGRAASRSVNWSIVRGPMMAAVTSGCATTNASARCASEQPTSPATCISDSTTSSLPALPGRDGSYRCGSLAGRPVVMSTSWPFRYLPVSHPPPSGLQAITPIP